ncbi:MAG: zf-TFIIB domain-containing protein [Phycisphaerae bacterium]|nr:zf-TFIIB domain-containing protein [Phycisphaerae bacterium]
MQCPVCKDVVLSNETLAEDLLAKACRKCQGRWLPSFHYWKWLDSQGLVLTEKPLERVTNVATNDSGAGKLCPECGHFLRHNKVGHGIDFCLDRCNHCGGVWFDHNEWEILVSRNMHCQVHYIFSAAWQKRIQDEEREMTFEQRVEKIVGKNDYARLKEVARWIAENDHKETLLSYLQNASKA